MTSRIDALTLPSSPQPRAINTHAHHVWQNRLISWRGVEMVWNWHNNRQERAEVSEGKQSGHFCIFCADFWGKILLRVFKYDKHMLNGAESTLLLGAENIIKLAKVLNKIIHKGMCRRVNDRWFNFEWNLVITGTLYWIIKLWVYSWIALQEKDVYMYTSVRHNEELQNKPVCLRIYPILSFRKKRKKETKTKKSQQFFPTMSRL